MFIPSVTRHAFALHASIIISMLAGSSAPTPLYATYQAAWGFSPITTTIVFGIYAIAVLASLLVLGSLSDHLGRRPILVVALALQIVAMIVYATAGGVPALIVARVIQGLSTGAAVGALGATLLDLDRARGTIANAIAPLTGTAVGSLASGFFIEYLPAPTQLPYVVLAVVFALQATGIALLPAYGTRAPGVLASLRPKLALPATGRHVVALVAPVVVATWATIGFYGSLGPALVKSLAGSPARVLGGLAVFAIGMGGVASVLALRNAPARRMLNFGIGELVAGVAIVLVAVAHGSVVGFFAGSVIAGAGIGAGFQGALRTVMPLATARERAGTLSTLFVICYLAAGVPTVLAGYRVVHGGGVTIAAHEYGLAVLALGLIALVGQIVAARRHAPSPA